MSQPARRCLICCRQTEKECSHIECPNRHPLTAAPTGEPYYAAGSAADGAPLISNSACGARRAEPTNKE